MRVIPVGPRAVLVEVEDELAAASLASWSRSAAIDADEVVPAAATVLFDGVVPGTVRQVVRAWPGPGGPVTGHQVSIPVTYDGPDLSAVADLWGCTEDEVVARHTSVDLVSAFCGFAPGFAYLSGFPPDWPSVPRRPSPRARVPSGSVAVADRWCAVYPVSSPGGWLLIGTTDVPLWEPRRDPPALLPPGTRVRFEVA